MKYKKNQISTILIIIMMLFSAGCLGNDSDEKDVQDEQYDIIGIGCMDSSAINFDPNATTPNPDSCEFLEDDSIDLLSIPHTDGCDNTNPIHCMLPFPSDAFLVEDNSTVTGKRISYSANTLPRSGTVGQIHIPIINQFDGASPNTQIMTAFDSEPDLSEMAGQYNIEKSLEVGHSSMIINQDTGEIVPHWTELDVRSDDSEPTIIHLRTIKALDHDTSYVVLFSNLQDLDGNPIDAPVGFAALRDNVITNSPDIEERRSDFNLLFTWITENTDRSRNSLQTAWVFNTASTESIIGPLLSMRNDALDRIGENGINCTVETSEEVMDESGNRSHWMITGTYTAPQYTESFYPPTLIRRTSDTDRTPVFVENREIPFWLLIPQTAISKPADLTIWGHGFLGTGDTSGLYGWANENNAAMLGTSFYGWSSDDTISIEYAVLNMENFQHQAERLEQSMINQVVMIKSFMGICSDLPELYHNGTSLVDVSNPVYTGYSNGAIRGPSIIGLSPDLKRGVLWAGGSSFSHIIERCTQYDRFHFIFASDYGYASQLDRAVAISIMQSLWDSVEADTFLYLREEGYLDQVEPYELMTLFSIADLQISNISSSRMMRTANIPILNSSTIAPYGIDIVNETHQGSVGVFFDGGYIHAPDGNEYGVEPHPAHNAIGGLKIARDMAFSFLQMNDILDTCNGNCTFSPDNLSWN